MKRFEIFATILMIAWAAALAGACKGRSKGDEDGHSKGRAMAAAQERLEPAAGSMAAPMVISEAETAMELRQGDVQKLRTKDLNANRVSRDAGAAGGAAADEQWVPAEFKAGDKAPVSGNPSRLRRTPEGPTRAWFPETFLFQPLVVTDDRGAATVPVRVPDRLTTWRVLALGHSRSGAQGGAVTSFLGTLPVYVDPVVPPFLVSGDQIRLPIQMINTTNEPVTAELSVEAEHAELTALRGARTIPAQGSLVEYAALRATRPGAIKLRVGLGDTDAVLRTIDVVPAGRPIVTSRSGTLAAPRKLSIEGPAGADPATDRARLLVFPGALALLRAELGVSVARSGVNEDAYALLLAGRAPALLAALGDQPDAAVLRDLSIVAAQRAIRHGRTLDVAGATALTAAALAHPQNPVLARLGERAAEYLQTNQRPDGTFAGGQGWTLQRVLMATADATRAVAAATATTAARQRAQAVAARASGAFERNLDAVPDGFTAAAILASGAAPAAVVEKLRQRVREAIAGDAGGKWLSIGEGVVRADGSAPGRSEATALAVLALDGDPKAAPLLADLGATLLGSYSPAAGWGDGRANLACMQAVLALFKAPLPANVKVTLTLDGSPVATGNFDREKLRDVLVLEGPVAAGSAGAHEWAITAEPAVPGLGYSLVLQSYVPWEKAAVTAGLELSLPADVIAAVGKPVDLAVTAVAPSGMELHITQALPAGVQVDRPSLEALVGAGTISRFETADGKVDLYVPALNPGQVFAAKYRAIPTLAGKLQSAASRITAGRHEAHVPPARWTIN